MTLLSPNKFGGFLKKVFGFGSLGLMVMGGALSAAADSPAFNNLPQDYPTLQVRKLNTAAFTTSASGNPGDVFELLVWDHNTVPGTTAQNVKIKVTLPGMTLATSFVPSATVSADNATAVTGTSTVTSSSQARMQYVPDSATLLRNVNGSMTAVSWPTGINKNDVVGNGINLGNQDGCWQYAQAVLLQVKLTAPGTPIVSTNKKVALAAAADWSDTITAQPGDQIFYKVYLENIGTETGVKPQIKDTLDSRQVYDAGSSYAIVKRGGQDYKVNILDSDILMNGNTFTWAFVDMAPQPDAAMYLIWSMHLKGNDTFPVGTTVIHNTANSSFASGTAVDTNTTTVNVVRQADKVVNFTVRKESTNKTLGDARWYHDSYAPAGPGDTVAFRLIVTNTGNTPSQAVTLKDILPAGLTFKGNVKLYNISNPNGVTISGADIVNSGYVFTSIVNGTDNAQTIVFEATANDLCDGQQHILTNKAQVLYLGAVKAEDVASVAESCTRGLIIRKEVKDPSDGVYKTSVGPVSESTVMTFRITVTNNGTVTLTSPIAYDILPSSMTYIRGTLAIDGEFMNDTIQNSYFTKTGIVLTNLAPGLGKTITFQAKVSDCPPLGDSTLTNTAFAKANLVSEVSASASVSVRVARPTF
jgi:uncharacterized repeat protein (TIGR01451 family)